MAKIIPFKAVIYNPDKVKNLSAVICPPYDIISKEKQLYYHKLDSYNLIHLELGLDLAGEDKYQRAGRYFNEWLQKKILIQEKKPALYFYSQQYTLKGEKRTRFGFIALLKLNARESGIFGHEHTHLEPKEDRLHLIRQVQANLSPIFVLFADKKRIIQQNLLPYIQDKKPFLDIVDEEKINHRLWRIEDPGLLSKIEAKMEDENIFIADGHHRYEVACVYRDEMQQKEGQEKETQGYNYILAYFTNIDSLGLAVLPIHRLVKLEHKPDIESLVLQLKEYFYVEEHKDRTEFLFLLQKAGQAEHALGMYNGGRYWLLRLKNIKVLDKIIADKPPEYRAVDVAILNAIVLKNILQLDLDDKSKITFSPDAEGVIAQAEEDHSRIAFLLNASRVEQIVAVALRGEKMPPKSTYFYPKVLSGLVINKHEG